MVPRMTCSSRWVPCWGFQAIEMLHLQQGRAQLHDSSHMYGALCKVPTVMHMVSSLLSHRP